MAAVLTEHDEGEPEPHYVDAGLENATVVEELGFAERPVIVMNRNFDDVEARVMNLLHHLEADHSARLFELDALEHTLASPGRAE